LELGLALVKPSFGAVMARDAQTPGDKVRAVLPRPEMLDPNRRIVGVYHTRFSAAERAAIALIRRSILTRTKVQFDYQALPEARWHRVVRPLEVQVWGAVLTLTAWCEDRLGFRVFGVDRMTRIGLTEIGFRSEKSTSSQDYRKLIADDAGPAPKDNP
jgi:predicted DNA-binding transcriptional regulator YafY